MTRWLVGAIILVTLAALGVGASLAWRAPARVPASSAALTQEVQALRSEVSRLRADAQPKIYVVSPGLSAATPATAPDVIPASEPPPERTPEQRQRDATDELETKFESEPIDTSWSSAMLRDIRDAVTSSAPTARLLRADCATSLCRVVLGHDAEDDQRGLMMQVGGAKPFQEGVFYDYDQTPHALKTTLYVLRQGYSFRD